MKNLQNQFAAEIRNELQNYINEGFVNNYYANICKCEKCNNSFKTAVWVNGYPAKFSSLDGYLLLCECGNHGFISESSLEFYS